MKTANSGQNCQFWPKTSKLAFPGLKTAVLDVQNDPKTGVQTPVSSGNWPKLAKLASLASLEPLRVTLGYPRNPKTTLKGSYQSKHFLASGTQV